MAPCPGRGAAASGCAPAGRAPCPEGFTAWLGEWWRGRRGVPEDHFQGGPFCYTQEGAVPLRFSPHPHPGAMGISAWGYQGPLKGEGGYGGAGDKGPWAGRPRAPTAPTPPFSAPLHACFSPLQQDRDWGGCGVAGYEKRADPGRNCCLPSHSQRHSCPPGARADDSFLPVSFFLSPGGKGWPRKAGRLPSLVVSDLPRFLGGGKEEGCILRRGGARWRGSRRLGYRATHLPWLRRPASRLAGSFLGRLREQAQETDSSVDRNA